MGPSALDTLYISGPHKVRGLRPEDFSGLRNIILNLFQKNLPSKNPYITPKKNHSVILLLPQVKIYFGMIEYSVELTRG